MGYPVTFTVSATSSSSKTTDSWTSSYKDNDLVCSIPKEFQGPGEGFGPGSLFGLSLLTCLIALLKVYLQKEKLSFTHLEAKADVIMGKDPKIQKIVVEKILVDLHIIGASDKEKVKKVADLSASDCAISNSIISKKTFRIVVE
jgi:organic hydroperoxide reductase OsmC/OhrA